MKALDGRLAELVPGDPRTELQRTILEFDCAATPLGVEEHWSPTLRTAVSSCLNSRFPILLMWGPELVMIYNDAYAPLLGARHSAALGRRAAEIWSDIWDHIGGMADEVLAGRATYSEDLPLVMSRHGFEEETYFTFSFSPVVEPGGQVAGLLDTVVETTKRVLATRRLGILQRLGSLPRSVHAAPSRPSRPSRPSTPRWAYWPKRALTAPSAWSTSPGRTAERRASSRGRASGSKDRWPRA